MTSVNNDSEIQHQPRKPAKPDKEQEVGDHTALGEVSTAAAQPCLPKGKTLLKPALKLSERKIGQAESGELKPSKLARKKRVGFLDRVQAPQVEFIDSRQVRDQKLVADAVALAKAGAQQELVKLMFTELSNEQVSKATEINKSMSATSFFQRVLMECPEEVFLSALDAAISASMQATAYSNEVLLTRMVSQEDAESEAGRLLRKISRLAKSEGANSQAIQSLLEERKALTEQFAGKDVRQAEHQNQLAHLKAGIDRKIVEQATNPKIGELLRQMGELELVLDDSRLSEGAKSKSWAPGQRDEIQQNPQFLMLRNLLSVDRSAEAETFIRRLNNPELIGKIMELLESQQMDRYWTDLLKERLGKL